MDPTQLVRQATPTGYPPAARGYIAPTKPAPVSFSEGVYVILPEGSTEHLYGPCAWPAIHGTRLPAPGAQCVVVFDEQNFPTVVWWAGAQLEPQPGAWVTPESFSAKLGEHATLQVRLEQGATSVRFKGFAQTNAEVPALTVLFTLPTAFRPKEVQRLPALDVGTGLVNEVYVNVAGTVESRVKTEAAHFFSFDALTFPLT